MFDSKKLMKSLTAGHGAILVPHIEAYQQRAKFPDVWNVEIRNTREKDTHFHPSGDCYAKPIDLWLARKGRLIGRPISPALRRTFDCGHMWHGYLQEMLIEMGLVKRENVERRLEKTIAPGLIGAGTADLVDVAIPGHGEWLVDIKTMNKVEFEQGASELTLKKWTAQVNCYMDWLGTTKAMVLAICKDSPHNFREYQIQKDPRLLSAIYGRWAYVVECLEKNVEPDMEYVVDPLLLNPGDSVFDAEVAKNGSESQVHVSDSPSA